MASTARFAVDNPRVILLAVLLMVGCGSLSYLDLPRQENPSLNERFARMSVYLPGAEPEEVELLVTQVMEDAAAQIDDIERILSASNHDGCSLLVQVDEAAPFAERLQQIRDKIQEARASFPACASEPDINTRVFRTNTMVPALLGEDVSPVALRVGAKQLERALETYLACGG